MLSRSVVSDSLQPHGLLPTRSFVHGILQARILEWVAISFSRRIFPTQESNLGLPHCRQILHQLSQQGSRGRVKGHAAANQLSIKSVFLSLWDSNQSIFHSLLGH